MLRLQARPCARARVGPLHARAAASTEEAEAEGWTVVQPQRLRLDNLSPQAGARKKDTRKGRGYGAGQVGLLLKDTLAPAWVCSLVGNMQVNVQRCWRPLQSSCAPPQALHTAPNQQCAARGLDAG